ncbi:MAG: DUF177 domain-containing protein [Bradymonadaceae bacterium]
MSLYELEIDEFDGTPVTRSLEPTGDDLEAIFAPLEEDFRALADPPFAIELTARLNGTTVHLSGSVAGTFAYQCGRCLTERTVEVEAEMEFEVLERGEWNAVYEGEEEIALEADDLDVAFYEGESVDLTRFIREAVWMALPAWPQCPDELRAECDEQYQEHVGDETLDRLEKHEVDLRWWPLRDIELDEESE